MADSRSGATYIFPAPESKETPKNKQTRKQANKNSYNNGRYVEIMVCQKDRGVHRKSSQWPKLEKHAQIKKVILDFNSKCRVNILDSILRYRYRNRY